MSKLSVAMKLADKTGVSFAKASKYIDDVGLSTARRSLDDAVEAGSRTVSNWWKPAAAGGGIIGGGALVWRQQDLERAKAIAEQQRDYSSALGDIMDSDLPPEAKRELVDELMNTSPSSGDGSGSGDDENDDGGGLLGNQVQLTLVLLIVVAFALKYSLGDE